ncbi:MULTISPECIES: tyrosine-type recombinase/integrase [unclassified Bradyrhizobium]|uniref:tyrosine-type recombinase/integrase n=1 Tax=unclassified Bradyrhizobium TaxID=2631580 RepID=UPI002305C49D|nr:MULTISPECIES: tyrosine-type recombinase/integrase [unclassified Bradyrhizobium]MDA9405280.1 integrase [Bradyrhizobium sp. CCBAU 45384]MDA9440923.1 integrase [Bradyrhizobium sp. CCBAU 51745]
MASASITIRAVQALVPGQAIWDAGHKEAVRGFGVRRQRDQATYVLKYRLFGRQRFFTIGRHGSPWTPEKARREAKRLLGLVADGKDPADTKAEANLQAADTLRKITGEYLSIAKKKQRPRTYSEVERYLLVAWKPLHSVSVFKITRRHVAARVADIAAQQGVVSAARARTALSTLFNWAIREGLDIPANPVLGTNRPEQPKSRERVLSDTELSEIWKACGDDDHGRILRLLILTAQRRDEVGGMRWPELDTVAGRWTLPSARSKNHREHVLPFVPTALALLPPRRNDGDCVFGNGARRKGGENRGFSGWSKSKAALDARILSARRGVDEDAKPQPHWTVHDLRRTAATMMADRLGVLPHIVEAILNHVSGHRAGVAGVYNRARYEAEIRDALERWTEHLTQITAL